MQSALCAYIMQVPNWLYSSVKGMFIERPNARKFMWVSMVTDLMAWKPKDFHQLNHPHLSLAWKQQYKIALHARHKLRESLIHSHTIKQSSCSTSIQFVSDLQTLRPQALFTNKIQTSWMGYNYYICTYLKSSYLYQEFMICVTSKHV